MIWAWRRYVEAALRDGPPLGLVPKQADAARERVKTRYNVIREQNLDEKPLPTPLPPDDEKKED